MKNFFLTFFSIKKILFIIFPKFLFQSKIFIFFNWKLKKIFFIYRLKKNKFLKKKIFFFHPFENFYFFQLKIEKNFFHLSIEKKQIFEKKNFFFSPFLKKKFLKKKNFFFFTLLKSTPGRLWLVGEKKEQGRFVRSHWCNLVGAAESETPWEKKSVSDHYYHTTDINISQYSRLSSYEHISRIHQGRWHVHDKDLGYQWI